LLKNKKTRREIALYIFFGALTTAVSFGTYYLFRQVFPGYGTSVPVALSWVCAVTFAFFTNKRWVFGSKVRGVRIIKEAALFYAARIFTLLIDLLLMFLLVDLTGLTGGWYELGARIAVSAVVLTLNYILSKVIVFKKVIDNGNK
jgi:putative flippase GtrA